MKTILDLINWSELSRLLTGSRSSITKKRISAKQKPKIDMLEESLTTWNNSVCHVEGAIAGKNYGGCHAEGFSALADRHRAWDKSITAYTRDLVQDLIQKGYTEEQAKDILNWTETLPIIITTTYTRVYIKQGVITVEPVN